jgi:hypothetical protein
MGRFRGLPAVLAMLLGGAALALAAGAVAYVVRSRTGSRADDGSGDPSDEGWETSSDTIQLREATGVEDPRTLGEQVAAELAETEAASEAALEFQALDADEPPALGETIPADRTSPLGLPVAPAARAERGLPLSARWTLMAAAVVVGALVGLMLFLLTGGTIGR